MAKDLTGVGPRIETEEQKRARLARETAARLQASTSGPAIGADVPDPIEETPETPVVPVPDPANLPVPDETGTIGPADAGPTDTGLYDETGWQGGESFQDLPISDIDTEYMNPAVKAALDKLLAQGVRGTDAEEAAAAKDIERGLGSSLASTRARGGFGGQFISGAASAQESDIRSRAADQLVKSRLGIQAGARDEWARDLGLATNAFDAASGRTVDAAGLKLQAEEGAADRALNAWDSEQDRDLTAFDNLEDRGLAAADLGITEKAFDAILGLMNDDEEPKTSESLAPVADDTNPGGIGVSDDVPGGANDVIRDDQIVAYKTTAEKMAAAQPGKVSEHPRGYWVDKNGNQTSEKTGTFYDPTTGQYYEAY